MFVDDPEATDWTALMEEAARWHARLEDGTADLGAFEAWRDANPHHAVAYARILDTADSIDALKDVDFSKDPGLRPRRTPTRRHWLQAGAGALVIAAGTGAWVLTQSRAEASTRVGERRSLTLSDGVRLELNTSTRIAWKTGRNGSQVWLEQGELSVVVPPSVKPCKVTAAGRAILMTAADVNVRLRASALEVTVVKGDCTIEGVSQPQKVEAGQGALVSGTETRVRPINERDLDFTTAWRQDAVVFNGQTLGVAVEEYNRYLPRPIVIVDPELAGLRIGGRFSTRDPADFLENLQSSFSIHVTVANDGSRLLSK
ncbi:FecR family protein [Asticcacaulis excentricus]|uniref:Anti-FecI sigma factor, FecR n=1 Tax=Asticcacaulis excentricus (strain ATCC 15261 / DSM 4724 / KCTC 12464 / NCIMB 9791 / VKM B-1370 / CB 48) TaxID=573065 RepID=E8RUN7_ASTEC|nr:FecR domain-containing protein [Asticcacaulis excentricus]ADU14087.1 anti-FecI sigma factor, FecR [Asticcacaulis excentricus CB 48]